MKKGLMLLLLVMIGALAISSVSASEDLMQDNSSSDEVISNSIEEITTEENECDVIESDNGNDIASDSGDYRSIQEQIDSASEGDNVTLSGSTYSCDYLVVINKTITLDGNGSTLIFDGSYKDYTSSFFHINQTASNVVLKNLNFMNGNLQFGGAITWEGDNGMISNCTFDSNIARGQYAIGGAIFMLGNNCTVANSIFKDNVAHQFGGAILWNGTDGTISNCEFIGNEANGDESGRGGALVIAGDNCTVINSNFTKNHCTFMGGAIFISNSTNSRIVNCNFDGNYLQKEQFTAIDQAGGGAIFSACEGLLIDGCNFTNNHANFIAGNIHLSDNDTVINSFFNKNYAIKDENGYEYGNDIAYFGSLDVYKNNIRSNTFILDYGELENYAVGIQYYDNVTTPKMMDIIVGNNTFIKTKLNSTISFSAGIIFDYATKSSPIQIIVTGGIVEAKNIKVLNHPEAKIGFSNNELTVSNLPVGKYTLMVTTTPDEGYNEANATISVIVNKATAVLSASSASVVLKKATNWDIKLIDGKSKKPIANMAITLKVYTGSKYNTFTVKTDSKGVAHFKTSSLAKGKHKVVVSGTHAGYNFKSITSYITVVKPTALKFKVYKRNNEKSGSLISFQVLNKKTKKPVNGIKVTFEVKIGSKYKKFLTLKTKTVKDKKGKKIKGITGFFTNKLTVGKHAVIVKPVLIKYSGSGKSSITIKKSAKKYPPKTTKV